VLAQRRVLLGLILHAGANVIIGEPLLHIDPAVDTGGAGRTWRAG